MSQKTMQTVLAIAALFFTMLTQTAYSQTNTGQCTTAIVSLAPCLGFITGNSSAPSASCCSQLSSVVQTNALCLCTLLNGGGSAFGININQTQALTLPGSCKIQTPPVSQCKAGANAPASAPSGSTTPSASTPSSPSDSTPSTPSVPSTPSGVPGSKTTPTTTDGSTSDSYKSAASMLLSSLLIAASLAIF